jgi:acyl transferase domain-containing protein
LDPQQRLLHLCVHECLERAGLVEIGGPETGVFVGLMGTEYSELAVGRADDAESAALVHFYWTKK